MFLEEPSQGYGEFTGLHVWKKAMALKLEVYGMLKLISASDKDLRCQLRQAVLRCLPTSPTKVTDEIHHATSIALHHCPRRAQGNL